ncbi:MAG: hypothetical protein IKD69_08380 [Solobacterium sp.]|nr:hypothetical protein [Solobacterium sp.]
MFKGELYRALHHRLAAAGFILACILILASGLMSMHGETDPYRQMYAESYQTTLQEHADMLDSQIGSVLFQKRKPQLMEERKIVAQLLQEETVFQDDSVIRNILESEGYMPLLFLAAGLILIYALIEEDHVNRMSAMYRAAVTGRTELILAKMGVILFVVLVLYLIRLMTVFGVCLYAGADLSAHIQTVSGYLQYNLLWNIRTYFIFMSFTKLVTVFVLLWGFLILLEKTGNLGMSFVVLILFMTVEYLLDLFLSLGSPVAFLKSWNFYHLLTMTKLDAGLHIPVRQCLLGLCLFLCFSLFVVLVYDHPMQWLMKRTSQKAIRFRFVDLYWLRDILHSRKGIVVLLVLFLYCAADASRYEVVKTSEQQVYEACAARYYGPLDDTLLQRVQNDLSSAAQAEAKAQEIMAHTDSLTEEDFRELDALRRQAKELPVLSRISAELEELKEAGAKNYGNYTGIRLFVNQNGSLIGYTRQVLCFLPMCLLMITVLSPVFQSGLIRLYDSSAEGRRKYLLSHFVLFFLFGCLTLLIVYGFHARKIFSYYETVPLHTPANELFGISSSMPLYLYLAGKGILDLLVIAFLEVLAMDLAQKAGGLVACGVMTASLLVFLLAPVGISSLLRYDFPEHPFILILTLLFMSFFSMISWRKLSAS